MKKLILITAVVFSAFFAAAQQTATVSSANLTKGKTSGTYVFTLPDAITNEQVEKVKGYYKDYFSVNFDAAKHTATIGLVKNEEVNKRVVNRFMVSLDIRTFAVDGNNLDFDTVFEKYMK